MRSASPLPKHAQSFRGNGWERRFTGGSENRTPPFRIFFKERDFSPPSGECLSPPSKGGSFLSFLEAVGEDTPFPAPPGFFSGSFSSLRRGKYREMGETTLSLLRRWCWPEKNALLMGELLHLYGNTREGVSSSEAMDLLERFGFSWLEDFSELLSLEPQRTLHGEELQKKCLLWKARLRKASRKGLLLSGKECMRILECPPGPSLGSPYQSFET